ncbi:SH3 domain-containing protein [Pleurostoma richardsiae]|uniref:SH3 domain-containing protein n=1 Tax=Pleurostoma richardsiae TaxID=41990 RepID=A0AA38RS13_9PEZI|nr:SH3 domain-containing protein [Pleurostoma richardsiae]
MGIDAEELIIRPFQEVVERGKEAVANAEAVAEEDEILSSRMVKAANAIVREGERALKRLKPLWDGQVEKFGDAFKDGMSKNEEIEDKRRKLEDILYDFEDYIDADTFEPDRFAELQAATKLLALDVIDVIKKIKVEIATPAVASLPAFPPLPPLPLSRPPSHASAHSGRSSSRPTSQLPSHSRSTSPPASVTSPEIKAKTSHLPPGATPSSPRMLVHPSKLPPSAKAVSRARRQTPPSLARSDTKASRVSSVPSVDPLPPYTANEGHLEEHGDMPDTLPRPRRGSSPDILGHEGGQVRIISRPGSMTDTESSAIDVSMFPLPRTTAWVSDQALPPPPPPPLPILSPIPRLRSARETLQRETIPENEAVAHHIHHGHAITPSAGHSEHIEVGLSVASSAPSTPVTFGLSPVDSVVSTAPSSITTTAEASSTKIPESGTRSSSLAAHSGSAIPPISLPSAAGDYDEGLMLADEWTTVTSDGASTANGSRGSMISRGVQREADCSIGPRSSLHQMKGFCQGAQAFKVDGHTAGVKRVAGYVAGVSTPIARCVGCGYGHSYEEIALDLQEDPSASFHNSGIEFRIRFLYKSHLPATRMTEAYYACLFCAHTGSVVREGDATVFRCSDHLFRHLARHPQPLPSVPGLTVFYSSSHSRSSGPAATTTKSYDFDLHFTAPPIPRTAAAAVAAEIARLPVATATKNHVQRYGEKKLPRAVELGTIDLLQFFSGARIMGVEFLSKLGGKWCTGWHDGEWGAFPARLAEVERPRRGEAPPVRLAGMTSPVSGGPGGPGGGESPVSVVARWKWEVRDADGKKGWLAFDRGDRISNVAWVDREGWCWSGTGPKGRAGVFPRSHVDEGSLKVEEGDGRGRPASRRSGGGGGGGGGGGTRGVKLFGRRKTSTSAASSVSGGSGVVEIVG